MNDAIALLTAFGFTARDASKIAKRAYENGLSRTDIQAWIDEAQASTSLHNPLGFVRARLQDGDRPPQHVAVDPHISDRHRYATQWPTRRRHLSISTRPVTQTASCGHVTYTTQICPECGQCPRCCKCSPEEIDEE